MMHLNVRNASNTQIPQDRIPGSPSVAVTTQVLAVTAPIPHMMFPLSAATDLVYHSIVLNPELTVSVNSSDFDRVERIEHSRHASANEAGRVAHIVVGVNPHKNRLLIRRAGGSSSMKVTGRSMYVQSWFTRVSKRSSGTRQLKLASPDACNGCCDGTAGLISRPTSHRMPVFRPTQLNLAHSLSWEPID
uniref:Uncharacterized protein n=1 Tax=Riboviria sp. TaxID=2585031 RepID=A0A8K1U295_9VIRU|nr:MAG: hypothetical protein 3 [Riboviria sp.]